MSRRFPGSLLEGVKHVDTLGELGYIEDSMFEPGVDANLLNAGSGSKHRPPIIRLQPLLDTAQLEPRDAACVRRKSLEVAARRSEPKQRLVQCGPICKD